MHKIEELENLEGKKAFVRVDYNVPVKDGKITDNERVVVSIETINFLTDRGAAVILCSHLGRPKGEVVPELSLKIVSKELSTLLKKEVTFVPDCVGAKRDEVVGKAKDGDIILLENVRFHPEEEANDENFARQLADGCDLYINDAFSSSHRAHASMVGVVKDLPGYAGFQLQKEIDNLSRLLDNPEKPFVFISGGAKVSDKIGILENLIGNIDTLLIGGGMANTFLCSQRVEVGCSFYEEDFVKKSFDILTEARAKGVKVVLPKDVVVTKAVADNARGIVIPSAEVGELDIIADVGPETVNAFVREIKSAKTIFWNGPLGITEYPNFAKATIEVAKAVARSDAFSIMGGGDSVAAIPEEISDKFSFVSMAGGASMEYLEGKELPGLAVLE